MLRSFRVSRRTRRTSLSLLAAAGLALSGAACADSSTGNAANGKITVLLKDAPGDVKSAVVTISQIYLQGSSEGDDPGSRVILRNTPVTTDLLTLANSTAELVVESTPNWMVWQQGNLLGTFDERALEIDAGVNWTIGDRQELRVKLQAIGLDAKLKQAWRTGLDGTPMPVADHVDDFSLRNLGFQVRYRYELAPLSDLYVVYGRGGYMLDEFAQGEADQLRDAFSLRDSEMLLVKLSYRFEL